MFNHYWGLGVAIALLASFVSNLGSILQKLYHTTKVKKWWFVGLVLVGVGSVGDIAALLFTPQVLVASLGPFTLVANVLLAPLVLKETVDRVQLGATSLIIVGSVLAVVFGPHKVALKDSLELIDLFFSTTNAVYAAAVACFLYAAKVGLRAHRPAFYALLSGAFGGHSVLCFKICTETFQSSIVDVNASDFETNFVFRPFFALMMLLTVMNVVLQIFYLNKAFSHHGEALFVLPIFQTFWVLFSILTGLIYFNDFKAIGDVHRAMFVCSVMTSILGLYVLLRHHTRNARATADTPLAHTINDPLE